MRRLHLFDAAAVGPIPSDRAVRKRSAREDHPTVGREPERADADAIAPGVDGENLAAHRHDESRNGKGSRHQTGNLEPADSKACCGLNFRANPRRNSCVLGLIGI